MTIIGLIIYPVINNLISDSKDDLYKKQIEELERISNTWVAKNYKKLKLEAGYSYNLSFEELKEAGLISEQHIKNPKTGELLEGCITLSYNSENKNYDIKYDSECQAYGETKHPTIVLSTNSGVINGYGYATSNFDVVVSGSNITSYMYCKGEYECEPDTKVESSSGIIPISNNGTTYVCAIGTNEFMSSEKVCKVYKLDKTKPEEGELVIDGTLGENGWYVSDVKLSVRDVEGVTSTLNITEITRDTSGTEIIMTSKNNKTGAVKVTNYTVKVDKTKPTVGELVINGTKGNNGWYKSDVVFSVVNGNDTLSGHADTISSIASITKDTKGTKVIVTTKDKAGNTSTKEYTVKVDKTAPTAGTLTINGEKGSEDWYLSDVTLTVNDGSDATSGHAKTTSTHTSVIGETTGTKVVVTTIDNAGNTSTREYNIKIDKNKPTEGTLVIDGTLGENGWYVSDVKLSVKDIEGVTSTLNITEITSDTSGQEVVMTTKNNKTGAVKVTKYTIKVDKTKPTVGELVINGTKGNNGWYTSDVTFSVKNGSDSTSGHATTTSSITSIIKDTKGTKVIVTTKDKAGNTSTKEYIVKVDKTAPTAGTLTISGTKGSGDWYLSDVTLTVNNGSDSTSGHAKTTSTHTSVSGNTSGTKVVVTTVDNAGNTSTREYNIKIDKNKPTEGTLVIDGTLGENGWYVSNVNLSVKDIEGVTSTLNINKITSNTAGTEVVMTSKNNKTGAVKVTKYTVKVDKTKPTVGELVINGTKGNNGWYTSDVTFSVKDGSDSMSGHASTTSSITSITKDTKGTKVILTTKDNAGNTTTKEYIIKMDKTAPTIEMVNPTNGNWTNKNIEITSNFSDNISGIVPSSLAWSDDNTNWHNYSNTNTTTFKDTWSGEGNRTGYNKVCDYAGNCSTTSTPIRIDKTNPIVGELVVASGTLGTNGWYTSNVVFSVKNGSDALSGHGSTTSSISSITTNTKGTNVVVTTKDKAGNSTAKTYTFKVDKNAPTITPKYSTVTIGSISEVNVSDLFIINYSTSGGSIKCNVAKTSNIKGVNNPLKCTATGGNGLTASASIIVKNPLVSIAVTKNPNKMEYRLGDAFDKTGMVVTATYKDGTTRAVTNYTLSMETRESDSRGNKRDGGYGLNYLYPERNDKKNIIDISYTEDSVTATTNIGINTYIYPDQVVKYYVVASYYDIYDISDINWSNPTHYFGIYGDYRSYDNDYSNTTYGCKYTVGSNYLLSTSTNKNYMCTLKYDFYTLITDGSYWDSGYYEKDRNYILTRTNNVGYSSGTAIWLSDIDNNASADSQNVTLTVDELRPTWYMGVACNRGTCTIRHTMNSLKVSGKSYPIVVEAGF